MILDYLKTYNVEHLEEMKTSVHLVEHEADSVKHEFTAKFLMDTSLFPVSVDGIFLVHSVLNGGEVDNLKVTAGTNVIQADGHQYEILKNDDTWTICCLKVTSLA